MADRPLEAVAANRDIVVIGGSTGATRVLRTILASLPEDLPASILIVTHVPERSIGMLARSLEGTSRLVVGEAEEGEQLRQGRVYVARPDFHLMLRADGTILLARGPRENLTRPAIDPLFRSAAAGFGARVVGVLLTGLLNDGASGLKAIKDCGGVALVQDPLHCEAGEMPLSALETIVPDAVLPPEELAEAIERMVRASPGPTRAASDALRLEVDIASGGRVDSDRIRRIGAPSPFTCPACQGVLNEMEGGDPLRFRCQVGHAYTAEALERAQEEAVDEALRVALRVIEERAELVRRMGRDARANGRSAVAEMYESRAAEYRGYAETIRRAVLLTLPPLDEPGKAPRAHGAQGGGEGGP